ncbi:MAG TPA: hypothetical protein VI072_36355 [Polyangiaceae bacterium]
MSELDPEELADARAALAWERSQIQDPNWIGSELVVTRRPIQVLPAVFALGLALIVGLQAPLVGVVTALVIAVLWLVADRRRVARLRVERDGSLTLPGRAPIAWSVLRALELRVVQPPWWSYTRETGKLAGVTLLVRFWLPHGPPVALARGAIFSRNPWRHVDAFLLQRWMIERALASGMRITAQDAEHCVLQR